MFARLIESIITSHLSNPNDNKAIIVVGQRRVGKTVLLEKIREENPNSTYFDLEAFDNQQLLTPNLSALKALFGRLNPKNEQFLLILDELQNLENSGTILKLIHDHFPRIKVLASGSSSYLMMTNIGDSLYGRKQVFELFPLTVGEIFQVPENEIKKNSDKFNYQNPLINSDFQAKLDELQVFGTLPEVFQTISWQEKQSLLGDYVKSLLFKDIFSFEGIRNPEVFKKLLFMLSLQIGNLVNPHELAQTLGVSRNTILEYINIYEKFYILFRLPPFANNQRKEVHTKFKIYFYDLGIRNALANTFSPIANRSDSGAIFENFVAKSILVNNSYFAPHLTPFYWRSHDGFEVDLILKDVNSNRLTAIEITTGKPKKPSRAFKNTYGAQVAEEFTITPKNSLSFIV